MSAPNHLWPNWLKYAIMGLILFTLWIFNQAFVTPLFLGFILATLSYPLFQGLQKLLAKTKQKWLTKPGIAALLTVLGCTLVFGLLANFLIRGIAGEVPGIARSVIQFVNDVPNNQGLVDTLARIGVDKTQLQSFTDATKSLLGSNQSDPTKPVTSNLFTEENVTRALAVGQKTLGVLFDSLIYLVIFFLAWLNGLTHGKSWMENIFKLLPLSPQEANSIKKNLQLGIRNVIYANFVSGLIHAGICFVLMLVFGVPNIWTLTLIIFLIGVLPVSPSELGYAIVLAFIFPKSLIVALILIPLAELVILYVNYVLLPKIIAAGDEGNTLLILTSILSGIAIFGLMGFVIGPVIMIFIQTLYRILVDRLQKEPIYETMKSR